MLPLKLPRDITSFDQLCARLPQGAYTTLRTYDGERVLHLAAHLGRLQETAELAGTPVRLDREAARRALREVVMDNPQSLDLRLRLVLDLEAQLGDFYIMSMPLKIPSPEAYANGVWVLTSDLVREAPRAKLTRFIGPAYQARQSLPNGAHEALMVGAQGRMREGLSSNFFAVLAGQLHTAGEGVLEGTTRGWVLELAESLGIDVNLEAVRLGDLPDLEEAFLTSSSRGVLPVRQIGETVIGPGWPGAITRKLMGAYIERLVDELEEI